MSVWSAPCYSLEPLRLACNNMPPSNDSEFPEELSGVADFAFGDCSIRHPERAGRVAGEFFKDSKDEWNKFCKAGRKVGKITDQISFRSAIKQTNIKYAGIKAVYWCFSKFKTGEWKLPVKAEAEDILEVAEAAFTIGAPASRANQEVWKTHADWIKKGAAEETGWAKSEEIADSVRFIWSLRTTTKSRKVRSKVEVILNNSLGSKVVKARVDDTSDSFFDTFRYDTDTFRKKFSKVMSNIREKVPISRRDAIEVALPPHVICKEGKSTVVVFSIKEGLIFYDVRRKVGALLWKKDHERLVQMLQSDAKLTMYYSKYDINSKKTSALLLESYNRLMDMVVEQMVTPKTDVCNKLCRTYDVCQFIVLARLADDITDMALITQLAKFKNEGLDKICDLKKYLSIVENEAFGVKEMLELAKFCKIFPCPDFCIHSVVDSVQKKSDSCHKASESVLLRSSLGKSATANEEEFHLYAMRNRAFSFLKLHGFFPGKLKNSTDPDIPPKLLAWPNVSATNLDVSDMKYIDMKGTFVYRYYDDCEIELVKDKVIAPTIEDIGLTDGGKARDLMDYDANERNQVLKFLFDPKFKSQRQVRDSAVDGSLFTKYRQEIFLALKPEAKKPGSRAFSMASDEVRRLLSEAEANIAPYVKVQAGSSQGKSDVEITKRMALLAATPDPAFGTSTCMFSFDLEGFSPMQNKVFKERAMRSWSEVFDEKSFDATSRIFTDTELVFEKMGVRDTFKMVGNDLEGFHGRLNTAAHIDLMGYTVFKLRELELVRGSAALEVLIDDGLMRVNVSNERGDDKTLEVIDIIDKMYQFAGQKISWDKTFVSGVMCQYLNRIYYDGIEVTPGAKSFLRIGKQMAVAVPTISDELMAHASTTRGSIQSGADHILSYYAYMVEIAKTLFKWGLKPVFRDKDSLDRLAFALYVPVALGGFGISSLYGLATNESLCSTQSGLAAMKMITYSFRKFVPMANTYLNSVLREMSPEEILRNPNAYRTTLRCLNSRRFANVAKAHIVRTSTNALIKAVNRGDFDNADKAIVDEVNRGKDICEVKRKFMNDMTIGSYVDKVVGKLQNSSTAASIVGHRKLIVVAIANRSEAKRLILETLYGSVSQYAY